MKVSAHLITWGEAMETGMRELSSLGFTACETFTRQAMQYEDRIDEFKELLAGHGLRLSALYAGGRFTDPAKRDEVLEYNERVARFLAAMGVDRIVFGPGAPRDPAGTPREGLEAAAETINEAAKRCHDVGVLACVHPHLFTEIETRDELDFIMERTGDSVGLTIDTAHLAAAGMDVAEVVRTYRDRLEYLHVKDLRAGFDREQGFTVTTGTEQLPIFCELGTGTIDLPRIFSTLRDIGYDGWVTVEIDSSTTTPLESLTVCRDYLQDELGLSVAAGH